MHLRAATIGVPTSERRPAGTRGPQTAGPLRQPVARRVAQLALALALRSVRCWSSRSPPTLTPSCSARSRVGLDGPDQPQMVIFEFNQNVGGTLGAVRVYNAQGEEVDNLDVSHPQGNEHWMGVGLKPGLPDGTYTATYRVISADTHIVYGGLVFSLGHAGPRPSSPSRG